MEIPVKEQRILLLSSGNRCAFLGCSNTLVQHVGVMKRPVVTGQIAHIISESADGPRGTEYLPQGEHNKHTNLIYLCPQHHKEVDDQPEIYTVERLRQMKADHEAAIQQAISHSYATQRNETTPLTCLNECVYSTLLPVLRMPKFVWSAPSTYTDTQERAAAAEIVYGSPDLLCPFTIRDGGTLYAFNNLRDQNGPFSKVVQPGQAKRTLVEEWLEDGANAARLSALLNRALNKLTGRKGLRLDREHRRYFFQADEPGRTVAMKYRPMNRSTLVERNVVWQPVSKQTGQARPYWYHVAASLRLLRTGANQWCLSIRPEMRVTKDGLVPVEPKSTGSHVTRKKAKMYNYDLLEELNFWRDFLSDGKPRISMNFGNGQRILISTTPMSSEIIWPGMPEEFAKAFRNVEYEEDLFTLAELSELGDQEEEGGAASHTQIDEVGNLEE
ncbi:MAG TPA: hypothetical protein VE957_14140 [Terriglobales bacterium]|nr:hypothetical protein [Terriglobales bacterium]